MKVVVASLVVFAALSSETLAADKPVIAPAPSWVVPVTLPPSGKDTEAAVRILLSDQQAALEPGRKTFYNDIALKIQTPQGLAAGNMSFPWRPETDVLTVHKILIRRGDQTIDVLGSGQTFTVMRREQNLESATLDGVLTANIQPEGLQVGDVLEFAVSVMSSDATFKDHNEQMVDAWNQLPTARAHLRVHWPSKMPMRVRQTAAVPLLKTIKAGGETSIELSADNLEPYNVPNGAPIRYYIGRLIELTDFANWSDLGAAMAPLYQKAAILSDRGPLHSELQRIEALSPDPKIRTQAALSLVQDRIRYVALAMGAGGYVPADAELTWSRRYGDCKGKTALLLALLHSMRIDAEPVVVNTALGDGLSERLPMVALFNHVLVKAQIAGQTFWLDGTRTGDTDLDKLKVPMFGWGLPLVTADAKLVRMMPAALEIPTEDTTIRIDASSGLFVPAPIKVETILRGDGATATNTVLANLTGDLRDQSLRKYWAGQFDFVDVKSASATFNPKLGEMRLLMEGLAKLDWSSGWYETDKTSVGYKADFKRDPGQDITAPFAVNFPYFTKSKETILLPPGFATTGSDAARKAEVVQTVAGIEYRRHATFSANTFAIETSERSIAPEFPAKDAPAAQSILRKLFSQTAYLEKPNGYEISDRDLTAMLETTPTTVDEFVTRGKALFDADRYDEAVKDFSQANALDPKNGDVLARRGLAYVQNGDLEKARPDLDAASAIDPKNQVVFHARGLMAEQVGATKDAIEAYSAALVLWPDDGFALIHRASAYRESGNDLAALQDAAAALKVNASWIDLYLMRANIFRKLGKIEDALAEVAAAQWANPDNTYAQVGAANVYSVLHKESLAAAAYERALAIKPEPFIYLNRSLHRHRSDLVGRRADLEAALKLDPKYPEALVAKADLQTESGDLAGAVATVSSILSQQPGDAKLLAKRGAIYARSGDAVHAEKDFTAARAKATEATEFNALCWERAKAGVALEAALDDCNRALSKAPNTANYLDSRGLVFLRLGRFDDAIADYDKALAKYPDFPSSQFGRAIAWSRKGNKEKSASDAAAALKSNPEIQSQFERFGVRL